MRSAKLNFKEYVWRLLAVVCAFLGGSTAIFSEGDSVINVAEKIAPSKIYYVTLDIDRAAGPFLRQIKARISGVPAPHNSTKLYDGRQWDEMVDLFLTKRDSSSKQPFPVMVPLPAGCFDNALSAAKRSACLADPAAFAKGYIEISLHEVRSYRSLLDVLDSKAIPASEMSHKFYNQERWVNIVKNLNPKLDSSNMLRPGTILILPIVTELASSQSTSLPSVAVEAAQASPAGAANVIAMTPEDSAVVAAAAAVDESSINSVEVTTQASAKSDVDSKGKIYFTTFSIDRKAGPFVRQVKSLVGDVPPPYGDVERYEGRNWEELVDVLLTKQDASVKRAVDVIVPLPAACFDRRLAPARKDTCLKNPAAFASGVLSFTVVTPSEGATLDSILAANGVPAGSKNFSFYSRSRWANVVQNFNPSKSSWSNLTADEVIVMPRVSSVGESLAGSSGVSTESPSLEVLKKSVNQDSISGDTENPSFVETNAADQPSSGGYYSAVEAAAAENAARVAKIAELARAQKEAAEAEALGAKYAADYAEAVRRKNESGIKVTSGLQPSTEATSAAEALKDAKLAEAEQAAEAAKAAELSAVARAAEAKAAAEAAKAAELARAAESARAAEAERAARAAAKAKAEESVRVAEAARAAETAKAAEAARATKAAEAARAAELSKAAKAKRAAEALAAAKAAEALSNKVAIEAERGAKAAQAAKSAEEAVTALAAEAAERAKRLADAKRSMSGNAGDWERLPGKSVNFSIARNVLSSAKSPMLKKQSAATLMYTQADDETMEFFGGVSHSSFVKGQSESELLTRTDDPLEYFRFSSLDFGARFFFQGLASNMELYAGLYARVALMDVRYYISNQSDGVAYLLEDHTDHNVGLGITGGLTLTKKSMRYRLSAVKDLYEFVDQSLLIDRGNNRLTISYYTPRPEGRKQSQHNYDFFFESETVDIHLIEREANLNAQMKRFSVGLGLGVAW
jgi:hypothetical protein